MSSSKRSITTSSSSSSSSSRSHTPSARLSRSPSQSPSKKSRTHEFPSCAEKALEAITYREPAKRGRMAELQAMKERIEEAERKLEWLDELQERILLKKPAAEILEIADELCKKKGRGRKAKERAEVMWEDR